MLGDTAPIADFCEVVTRHGAALLVDEAHSFGVLGKHGRGLVEAAGVEDQVDVIVGTFSKSLGCIGGYAVSRKHDLAMLRAAARAYAYSASSSPSVMASARAALKVIRENPGLRERLLNNARITYGALQQLGYELGPEVSPIVGVHARRRQALRAWHFPIDPACTSISCRCRHLRTLLPAASACRRTPESSLDTIIDAFRLFVKRTSESITATEFGVIPADVTQRMEFDHCTLRRRFCHRTRQCLPLRGVHRAAARIDLYERIDRNVDVLDDFGTRVNHDAFEF
jgi:hypothetical protein